MSLSPETSHGIDYLRGIIESNRVLRTLEPQKNVGAPKMLFFYFVFD